MRLIKDPAILYLTPFVLLPLPLVIGTSVSTVASYSKVGFHCVMVSIKLINTLFFIWVIVIVKVNN